jgi:hypothetical protein
MNHHDAIRLFAKTLQNLEQWMDKAARLSAIAGRRAYPRPPGADQYPFVRQ